MVTVDGDTEKAAGPGLTVTTVVVLVVQLPVEATIVYVPATAGFTVVMRLVEVKPPGPDQT